MRWPCWFGHKYEVVSSFNASEGWINNISKEKFKREVVVKLLRCRRCSHLVCGKQYVTRGNEWVKIDLEYARNEPVYKELFEVLKAKTEMEKLT